MKILHEVIMNKKENSEGKKKKKSMALKYNKRISYIIIIINWHEREEAPSD